MQSGTHVYFPLRSNCAWFSNYTGRLALERRIKAALILYDRLFFQDGRYLLTVFETGSFDNFLTPESIPDRRSVVYRQSGSEVSLRVGEERDGGYHPILEGVTAELYQVDFYPIVFAAGLMGEECVAFTRPSLNQAGKKVLAAAISADERDPSLQAMLPGNSWTRKSIIKAVHHDTLVGGGLGLSVSLDRRVAPLLAAKNRSISIQAGLDLENWLLQEFVHLRVPDYRTQPWDDVLRVRESAAGRHFREMVHKLTSRIAAELGNLKSEMDLLRLTNELYSAELLAEVMAFTPTVRETVAMAGLNLFAGGLGTVVDLGRGVAGSARYHRSWISLLR